MIILIAITLFIHICHLVFLNGRIATNKSREKVKIIVFITVTLGLLLLLNCLRGINVGNDTESYYAIFNYFKASSNSDLSYPATNWVNSLEIGYVFLNRFFLSLSSNYQLFISVIAVFLYLVLGKTIYDYSESPVISLIITFLLLYHIYINVLREAIAMSIILIGFRFLKKDKSIIFILFVLLAFLFHKTAIVALVLLFIYRKKSLNKMLIISILSFVTIFSLFNGFSLIMSVIKSNTKYIAEENGLSTYLAIVFAVIIWVLIKMFKSRPQEKGDSCLKEYNFYSAIPFVHLCCQIMAVNVQILYRISYYFIVFYTLAIPFFYKNSPLIPKRKNLILALLYLVFIVYTFGLVFFRPEWYSEFDYSFFWNN